MKMDMIPSIVTELPGPEARKVLEKDQKFVSQSYTRVYPLVVKRAQGAMVEDVDSNRFLDFTSGIAVCNTGHCHPRIVEAIHRQAEQFIHMSGTDFYYDVQSTLAQKLGEITPGPKEKRVFFGNSGAEAIEAALKLARYHTKRPRVLAFLGAFHGRTMGALSLTASKVIHERGFSPLVPGITHIPYAYCFRCPYHLQYPKCEIACVEWIREDLFKRSIPPEEVAAIFVEPIQGEGGYIVPPPEFHQRLYELAKEFGILFVTDEVQTGMGRTGRMMAIEHWGVVPDIIALAKGIASGMPLGATVSQTEVMDWVPGSHASTFGGNPISCQAALATIELLEEGLIKNVAKIGNYILEKLQDLQKQFNLIGEVRGRGLMIGIELIKDRVSRKKAIEERNTVIQSCFEKGLLILGCGENVIRLVPPLIINQNEADTALTILEEVLKKVERG
ncbi:MAG: acetyl ornithine aminotransferase family protein [Deltaproteobacteria bacterium]|nr:acetyl ornithine aminotransferase family protein [Deltaproteobacteria bacterium]MBM4323831.1 acetyl ornithine aminotransferase family protein [Deltaproteobacteria bacterium]